jgi:hypothetical protein
VVGGAIADGAPTGRHTLQDLKAEEFQRVEDLADLPESAQNAAAGYGDGCSGGCSRAPFERSASGTATGTGFRSSAARSQPPSVAAASYTAS